MNTQDNSHQSKPHCEWCNDVGLLGNALDTITCPHCLTSPQSKGVEEVAKEYAKKCRPLPIETMDDAIDYDNIVHAFKAGVELAQSQPLKPNKSLQECKDDIARNHDDGIYTDWWDLMRDLMNKDQLDTLDEMITEAAELYAKSQFYQLK